MSVFVGPPFSEAFSPSNSAGDQWRPPSPSTSRLAMRLVPPAAEALEPHAREQRTPLRRTGAGGTRLLLESQDLRHRRLLPRRRIETVRDLAAPASDTGRSDTARALTSSITSLTVWLLVLKWRQRRRCSTNCAPPWSPWHERGEFNGEPDHVYAVLRLHPTVKPSVLVNNLKTISSPLLRRDHGKELRRHFAARCSGAGPAVWSPAAARRWRCSAPCRVSTTVEPLAARRVAHPMVQGPD